MKIVPVSVSNFNHNKLTHCFKADILAEIDKGKLRKLCEVTEAGTWAKHTYVTFYIDCPEDAIEILTNANLFTLEHNRGQGILSGSVHAFESFVTKHSHIGATVQERALANIFYGMLKAQFNMFKEYTVKQLTDRTFTMEK